MRRWAPQRRRMMPGPALVAVPATPLARRMAELAGLDLSGVTGSGDGGRVMKVDVERLLRSAREGAAAPGPADAPAAEPAAAAPPPAPASDLPHLDRPLTAMRRVTAQRMAEAKRSAPALLSGGRVRGGPPAGPARRNGCRERRRESGRRCRRADGQRRGRPRRGARPAGGPAGQLGVDGRRRGGSTTGSIWLLPCRRRPGW